MFIQNPLLYPAGWSSEGVRLRQVALESEDRTWQSCSFLAMALAVSVGSSKVLLLYRTWGMKMDLYSLIILLIVDQTIVSGVSMLIVDTYSN